MSNYTHVSFNYDSHSILNAIDNYEKLGPRPCTSKEIKQINDILNLKYPVQDMLYFSVGANRVGEIHIDENLLLNKLTLLRFAVNLPLLNASNTKMSWWKKKNDELVDEYNLGVYNAKFKILQYENADCIESTFYTGPSLVSVNNYHSVENLSNKSSHFISLRFDSDITEEIIIDYLSTLNS